MSNDTMISDTLSRLRSDAAALELLAQLDGQLDIAHGHLSAADPPQYEQLAGQVAALGTIASVVAANVRARVLERARQLGWQVATYEIAPEARGSGSEPVVFITGNSYLPPLRAYSVSETVWQLDDEGTWPAYVEALERRLEELGVLMECPDYDNALYVVDTRRFEYVEGGEGDTLSGDSLSGDWKPIESA